jgi:hypothetical protein
VGALTSTMLLYGRCLSSMSIRRFTRLWWASSSSSAYRKDNGINKIEPSKYFNKLPPLKICTSIRTNFYSTFMLKFLFASLLMPRYSGWVHVVTICGVDLKTAGNSSEKQHVYYA